MALHNGACRSIVKKGSTHWEDMRISRKWSKSTALSFMGSEKSSPSAAQLLSSTPSCMVLDATFLYTPAFQSSTSDPLNLWVPREIFYLICVKDFPVAYELCLVVMDITTYKYCSLYLRVSINCTLKELMM